MTEITRDIAIKVLETVDAGLVKGVGKPIPGQMCVEAAVCYALGLPHNDEPKCVAPVLRALKITLNDLDWSSEQARAKGLRRLALIQLGSVDHLDEAAFLTRLNVYMIKTTVPQALRIAASVHKDSNHKAKLLAAALRCEKEGTQESVRATKTVAYAAVNAADIAAYVAAYAAAYAADAAYAAAYAVNAADVAAYAVNAADVAAYAAYAAYAADAAAKKRDKALSIFAEAVIQILIEMNVPGCQWLDLVEAA